MFSSGKYNPPFLLKFVLLIFLLVAATAHKRQRTQKQENSLQQGVIMQDHARMETFSIKSINVGIVPSSVFGR